MDFVRIEPANLRAVWDFVKQGVESMPAEDWIAEDVYHAIRSGSSALYLAIGDTGPAGFLVLSKQSTEFTLQPILHVWLAYNTGDANVMTEGESLLRKVADEMGAQHIRFGSPRPGWAKRYTPITTTYAIPRNA
jgi:hypothetical protein